MSDISVPVRLQNDVGEWPDAEKWMADYDWIVAMLWGSFLLNGGQESWGTTSFTNPANAASLSDNWTHVKSGSSAPTVDVAREATVIDGGTYSMKFDITVAGSSDSVVGAKQDVQSIATVKGYTVAFGARVRASTGSKVRLKVYDGTSTLYSDYHDGDGTYQLLTVTINVASGASALTCSLNITADFTGAVYWDNIFAYLVPANISDTGLAALSYQSNRELTPGTSSSSFLPSTDATYDLGSAAKRWRDLYLSRALVLTETGGGSDTVSLKAPSSISASYSILLPTGAPTANTQVLKVKDYTTGETEWGSGGGQGGINYLSTNPDAESGTTGWATYADAAGTVPVDGTGGSPSATFARNTSSPLRQTGMFTLTKGATNRQGDGVSYDFTIDAADKAKILQISFDYQVSSAFVAGDSSDVKIFIYDVTNSVLIYPAAYTLQGGTGNPRRFVGIFQTASNSTSYRLIFHISTTNASAWTLDFDNVIVGPQLSVWGAPVTDWISYTPTVNGAGTVSNNQAWWRRVGDSMELMGSFSCGTVAASTAYIKLPTGYTLDPTRIYNTIGSLAWLGAAFSNVTGNLGGAPTEILFYDNANADRLSVTHSGNTGGALATENGNASGLWTTNSYVVWKATVPITGWGSNVQMSNDTDTRVVAARYTTDAGNTITNNTNTWVDFEDKEYDTHGAVSGAGGGVKTSSNNGGWKYTAPVSGVYRVASMVRYSAWSWANDKTFAMWIYKNGSQYAQLDLHIMEGTGGGVSEPTALNGSTNLFLNPGDYIEIVVYQDTGGSRTQLGNAIYNWVSVERLSGPSTIAATELVTAKYFIAGSVTSDASNPINFATKSFDSHGAVTTGSSWKFTAPVSGVYEVSVVIGLGASSTGMMVHKNGTAHTRLCDVDTTFRSASVLMNLIPGDYIDLRFEASKSTLATTTQSVNIKRVGSYVA